MKGQKSASGMFHKTTQIYIQRKWWDLLIKGILLFFFGLATAIWPKEAAEMMISIIGIIAILLGAYKLFFFFKKDLDQSKVMVIIEAIAGFFFGIMAFVLPSFIAVIAIFLISFWLLYYGVLELFMGFLLPLKAAGAHYKWLVVINGIISIIFGIIFLTKPKEALLTIMWLISFYAILGGIILIITSIIKNRMAKTSV